MSAFKRFLNEKIAIQNDIDDPGGDNDDDLIKRKLNRTKKKDNIEAEEEVDECIKTKTPFDLEK